MFDDEDLDEVDFADDLGFVDFNRPINLMQNFNQRFFNLGNDVRMADQNQDKESSFFEEEKKSQNNHHQEINDEKLINPFETVFNISNFEYSSLANECNQSQLDQIMKMQNEQNQINSEWRIQDNSQSKKIIKDFLSCVKCNKLIIDFDLDQKNHLFQQIKSKEKQQMQIDQIQENQNNVSTLIDENKNIQNKRKAPIKIGQQLYGCYECLKQGSLRFISCDQCDLISQYCSGGVANKTHNQIQTEAISPQLQDIIQQITFQCVFCVKSMQNGSQIGQSKFYHPMELRKHILQECEPFLLECKNYYKLKKLNKKRSSSVKSSKSQRYNKNQLESSYNSTIIVYKKQTKDDQNLQTQTINEKLELVKKKKPKPQVSLDKMKDKQIKKCDRCNYIKLHKHICTQKQLDYLGLKPEIKYCNQHQYIHDEGGKNKFSLKRIPALQNPFEKKLTFMGVLFDILKCQSCQNISGQPIKCSSCKSLFCKNCPLMHNDERFAKLSGFNPRCKNCFKTMVVSADKNKKCLGMSKLDEFDHSHIDNDALQKLTTHYSLMDKKNELKFTVDRNINQIIMEDLIVSCQFGDQDQCSTKQGTLQSIMRHQKDCRACESCLYLCPIKDKNQCSCLRYYNRIGLLAHLDEIRQKMVQQKEKDKPQEVIEEKPKLDDIIEQQPIPNQIPNQIPQADLLALDEVINQINQFHEPLLQNQNDNQNQAQVAQFQPVQRNRCKKYTKKILYIIFFPFILPYLYVKYYNKAMKEMHNNVPLKMQFLTVLFDFCMQISNYFFLLYSAILIYTDDNKDYPFQLGESNKALNQRFKGALLWLTGIYMVFMSLGMIFSLMFIWFTDYDYNQAKQSVKDHIKRVLLVVIFGPLHINLLAQPAMLGFKQVNPHWNAWIFRLMYFVRPFVHFLFYILIIPIQATIFHNIPDKSSLIYKMSLISIIIFPNLHLWGLINAIRSADARLDEDYLF